MRIQILCLIFAAGCAAGCASQPTGTLTVVADSHQVIVGGSTFVQAYLDTGVGSGSNQPPVAADWSMTPSGIITLTPTNNIMKVTGVADGQVVVTANADGQSVMIGFTVVSP